LSEEAVSAPEEGDKAMFCIWLRRISGEMCREIEFEGGG
jgi:hypothetical protein